MTETDLAAQPLSRDWLETRVLALIEDETEIDPSENLIFYGLDSIRVMELSSELAQHGVTVSFEELALDPTVERWWSLIEARRGDG
ncbi:phosphopantetheine-binding protein [Poseidonocella sp. HB161398]|uniref:phosphopantetheine-binding protein n=1 Tax=Poseidonocella sp. HB161398 TaxID=2320855 RepID=UPI0019801D5D|nr:phosphopantetheine-binding protein [Poseidonocella sp. HB161398]